MLRRGDVCPRCGRAISYFHYWRKGSRVYVSAVHYLGRSGGKKIIEKCYLGSYSAEEAERLFGVPRG
ncbi:hypothetical protein [Pyrobaculum neutrophilum]|uniref:Uncharacterized protein n=1 Tax=Pyrobaculum neutrophilum (strain DSM 2338 / JCM 9278 / NBRC 100436 / V24Sta) TaxID=444157 RepID=B1YD54_PYRNV|nr:hypothetical protein [Pyrobaculum neutrophilum]ACB39717.1 hypothetical protein Tneu_0778 [Pyrobaculum neutrophilum V24Sta]